MTMITRKVSLSLHRTFGESFLNKIFDNFLHLLIIISEGFERFIRMRERFAHLKLLLAVGGWAEGSIC